MPGGSVYKDHTFNKETAHTSHEYSTIHRTNFHSTVQVHEHPQYSTVQYSTSTRTLQIIAENRKYRRKQDEYTARK
jgi:hypothetical protein